MATKYTAKSLFIEAIHQQGSAGWAEFLAGACGDDLKLRDQVERLLQAHVEMGTIPQPCEEIHTADSPTGEHVGGRIGPYTLRTRLGEGGMGVVFLAEQEQPIRRQVALKVIKPGMDSKNVIARFEVERQALAMMDHPNIAHVLDVGTTEFGRPYFVMDLVSGVAVTEYCDKEKLSISERLKLFVSICQAVQHAHLKGIIHRDIKPTNVLVALHDGVPVPKVIDFGLAKALHQRLSDVTSYSLASQIVGTPKYMSPEQADLLCTDIDTRSDVYSLGVLLYELLTGTTPFSQQQLDEAGFLQMGQIIREHAATRPSDRVSTFGAHEFSTIAEERGEDPNQLRHSLRSELDWIALKALEKDRDRRYQSASAFAADVQRYLDGETVEACPPSTAYRLKKFASRNRVAIATASLIACALLIGTGLSIWQASRAVAAEQVANQERVTAERNLETALDAIEQLLAHVGNPELADIPKVQEIRAEILRDTLDFYERFKADSDSSPNVDYRAAKVYLQLGELAQKTRPDTEQVIETYLIGLQLADALVLRHPKRNDFRELKAELNLACADYYWMPPESANAELDAVAMQHFESALDQYTTLSLANPGHKDYDKQRGLVFKRMAALRYRRSPSDPRAAELVKRAVELGHVDCVLLAQIVQTTDPDAAEAYWRQAIADFDADSANSTPYFAGTRHLWWVVRAADFLIQRGDPGEAERLWREAIETSYKMMKDFPSNEGSRWLHARASEDYSQFLLQPERQSQALAKVDALVQTHPSMHAVRCWLFKSLGDPKQQLQMLTAAISEYPTQVEYYHERAKALRATGEFTAALADLNQVIKLDGMHKSVYADRGEVLYQLKQYENAIEDFTKRLNMVGTIGHPRVLRGRGDAHFMLGRYEEAVADFDRIIELGPHKSYRYKWRALPYFKLGRYEQALADITKAIELNPSELSALCWIAPSEVAACPDERFRSGLLKVADQAIELTGNSARAYAIRGRILAALGQEDKAFDDLTTAFSGLPEEGVSGELSLSATLNETGALCLALAHRPDVIPYLVKLVERMPQTGVLHYYCALAQLVDGQTDAYRESCLRMVKEFEFTENPMDSFWVAWTCVLSPQAVDDYAAAVRLAEQAVESKPTSIASLQTLGAILYRADRTEDALARLTEANQLMEESDIEAVSSPAYLWYFLAMTHHKLGHESESNKWLDKANEWTDNVPADEAWNRRMTLKLLRQEAEAL